MLASNAIFHNDKPCARNAAMAPTFCVGEHKYILCCGREPAYNQLFGTLKHVGLAMINCVLLGFDKKVLEAKDIVELAMKCTEKRVV